MHAESRRWSTSQEPGTAPGRHHGPRRGAKRGRSSIAEERQSVTRAADFPKPRRISEDDLEEIVSTFRIPRDRQQELRDFLDELVEVFAAEVSRERSQPTQKADRGQLEKARNAVVKARVAINLAAGPAAKGALRRTAGRIGTMLSASWIQGRFPDDRIAPGLHYWPLEDDDAVRAPARVAVRPVPVDDLSLKERQYFAEYRAREVILAVLDALDSTLADARRRIVMPPKRAKGVGGRNPLTQRRYLLANLARFWRVLGGTLGRGKRSGFADFAEAICSAIGWPIDGVAADVPKAIKLSRNWR